MPKREKAMVLRIQNSLRFGLNRHFKATQGTDIINDIVFCEANKVFLAKCVDLKRQGLAKVVHKPAILENDLRKLYECGVFSLVDPKTLQNKVFFEIMLFYCRRGRQNLRELKVTDFSFSCDDKGSRYVCKTGDELTKNRREDDDGFEGGLMYEKPGPNCPVASLELYIKHLNPRNQFLFQRPKKDAKIGIDEICYDNMVVGERMLGEKMKTISREAKLSKIYTNHSIRATSVTILDSSGFEARHIMACTSSKPPILGVHVTSWRPYWFPNTKHSSLDSLVGSSNMAAASLFFYFSSRGVCRWSRWKTNMARIACNARQINCPNTVTCRYGCRLQSSIENSISYSTKLQNPITYSISYCTKLQNPITYPSPSYDKPSCYEITIQKSNKILMTQVKLKTEQVIFGDRQRMRMGDNELDNTNREEPPLNKDHPVLGAAPFGEDIPEGGRHPDDDKRYTIEVATGVSFPLPWIKSRVPVPGSWSRFLVPVPGPGSWSWFLVPVPGPGSWSWSRFLAPGSWSRIPGPEFLVPGSTKAV
ncbi:hypothetical protein QZH41_002770 [Actinostola sp. cb2023]|nr:hypothetical protein QZH41_002770 [Actinostola sp. cb2023]